MIRSPSRLWTIAAGVAVLAGAAARARAQDTGDLREKYFIRLPDLGQIVSPGGFFRGAPGTNSGTPFAFGPAWRDAYIGAGYQNESRGFYDPVTRTVSPNNKNDGTAAVGFGVGDARDLLGLEVTISSLSTVRSGWFNRTAFSFKAHRMIGNTAALAVGVENAFIAGGQKSDGIDSWFGVASKVFLFSSGDDSTGGRALTISAGIGNGRFRRPADISRNNTTVNAFGSVALLVIRQLSVLADYTGQDLNVGLSIVPLSAFPVVFTPAIADVTQTASRSPRFILGVGIGMHF
ncbi:MAG TPA: hypothetical protein VHE78_00420 [Gemmatimonadaceae bacterium]|nr:hypothetical protein [Gemmatimonadaceae bacterium]